MDVVIDTNTWLKVIMMVAHCIASSLQWAQDELADKTVTLIMVGQEDVILKPLCMDGDKELVNSWHLYIWLSSKSVGDGET